MQTRKKKDISYQRQEAILKEYFVDTLSHNNTPLSRNQQNVKFVLGDFNQSHSCTFIREK